MSSARAWLRRVLERIRPVAQHPLALWLGFAVAHTALIIPGAITADLSFGDVTKVYEPWAQAGIDSGQWPGVGSPWVYPIGALLPIALAIVAGPEQYLTAWVVVVVVVDALAFLAILLAARGAWGRLAAWWWLAYLVAMGPIALGRIDAVASAVAIAGVALLARAPVVAGALVTLAAWIKVWPAAIVAAAVIALRGRWRVVIGAGAMTVVVVLAAAFLGAGAQLFGFITEQANRALQVESVFATPWIWDAASGRAGATSVYYNDVILTYEVAGPGTEAAAAITTPALVVMMLALLGLALAGVLRRVPGERVLGPLMLALTAGLIVFNKVGSPQFETWLAVPIVYGIAVWARGGGVRFAVPAVLAVPIGIATQLIYPYQYDLITHAQLGGAILLTVRNALLVAVFVWAVVRLVGVVVRRAPVADPSTA